jgi:uncharacterized protein with PIN domain
MRFIADCMLGKLARWLRILGYDTLYYRAISDVDLLQKTLETGRLLLTRDTRLFAKTPMNSGFFITSDHVEDQLQQVVRALHLDVSRDVLTRCIACNAELTQVEKSAVEPDVPDFIYYTHNDFSRCPRCGKIYWKGSHQAHIWERVKRLKTGAPAASNQTTE